jgi:hypothetical protein
MSLADEWLTVRRMIRGGDEEDIEQLRMAFYGGAKGLINAIATGATYQEVKAELEAFSAEIVKRTIPK